MAQSPTDEQSAIIHAPIDRHLKVSAGAGTGKSHTLRHRVERLLLEGVPASQILVVMFNKSAQTEFAKKLGAQLGRTKSPQIRTYHALGFNICKRLARDGLIADLRLETRHFVARNMAKEALRAVVGEEFPPGFNPYKPATLEEFLDFVSLVKSGLDSPGKTFSTFRLDSKNSPFIDAFEVFEELRKKEGVRFFSDLIYDPVQALINDERARAIYQGKLAQIIIDEYQDINAISQRLIYILAGDSAKVTAVGDDAQTLYGFRGSRPDYLISLFDNDFSNPEVYTLTRTFRYGHGISLSSNSLIRHNKQRIDKTCISDESTPATTIHWMGEREGNDTNPVLSVINEWKEQGRKLNEIAILVRVFAIAPPIELALLSNGIPYRLEGGVTVFESQEITTMLDVLNIAHRGYKAIQGEEKLLMLRRLLTFPHPGLNSQQLGEIVQHLADSPRNIDEAIREKMADLPGFIAGRLQKTGDAIAMAESMRDKPPADIIDAYLRSTECFKRIEEMAARREDAETQANTLTAFTAFCRHQARDTGALLALIDSMREAQTNRKHDSDVVLITSIHRAKGLEWPHVILPGLAESTFPYERENTFTDIESERRLFYVGITRCQEQLTLISPDDTSLRRALQTGDAGTPAGIEGDSKRASRFLYECDLKHSSMLGRSLHQDSGCPDFNTNNNEYYNSYLKLVGAPFRIG